MRPAPAVVLWRSPSGTMMGAASGNAAWNASPQSPHTVGLDTTKCDAPIPDSFRADPRSWSAPAPTTTG